MNCRKCNHPLHQDARFCDKCGKPTEVMSSIGNKASNKLTVLVIDDDPTYLEAYLFKFKKEGFDVVLARSGRDGLETVGRVKPSVILLDILMPDMGGLEVLRRLKGDPKTKDIPVVMASILGEKSDIEQSLILGAVYHVSKEHTTSDEIVDKVLKAARSSGV